MKRTEELSGTRFRQEDTRGMLLLIKRVALWRILRAQRMPKAAHKDTPDRLKEPFLNSHSLEALYALALNHFTLTQELIILRVSTHVLGWPYHRAISRDLSLAHKHVVLYCGQQADIESSEGASDPANGSTASVSLFTITSVIGSLLPESVFLFPVFCLGKDCNKWRQLWEEGGHVSCHPLKPVCPPCRCDSSTCS